MTTIVKPTVASPPDVKGFIKRAGSGTFRLFGAATARFRPDPDFMIIGTKRGGTTSLYFDLLKLPQVITLYPSARYLPKDNETKGIHFFDSNYWRGERWYRSYLPTRWARRRAEKALGKRVVVGEASPYYLFHPLAAERAARMLPNVKMIVLLREPAMRAYSHWKERRRSDAEPLGFAEAVAAEASRLDGEEQHLVEDATYYSYAHEQQSYVEQSRYARALKRWESFYGMQNILVLASERYYEDPTSTVREIARFLGIDFEEEAFGEHRNAAQGSDLAPEARELLQSRFLDDNAALEEMVGYRLQW